MDCKAKAPLLARSGGTAPLGQSGTFPGTTAALRAGSPLPRTGAKGAETQRHQIPCALVAGEMFALLPRHYSSVVKNCRIYRKYRSTCLFSASNSKELKSSFNFNQTRHLLLQKRHWDLLITDVDIHTQINTTLKGSINSKKTGMPIDILRTVKTIAY